MSGLITTSQVTELTDPKLQKIAERIALEAELAVEKVAASFAHPAEYPLASDEKSIERILESRFTALPQTTKEAATARAINRINAPAAERAARYGDLASVDLRTATAIDAQVQALPFPPELTLSADYFGSRTNAHEQAPVSPVLRRQLTHTQLELRIHKVRCVDETSGLAGSEAGDDEIYLGGSTVDESGDTEKVEPFLVRDDFDDGEEQTYAPPKQFAAFDLTEGTEFPKSYFATLVLAEVDNGGLPEILDKLLTWVKEKVTTALTALLGGLIGASGGPIGAAIGAVIGAAVNEIVKFIKEIWEDDPFKPATVRTDIPSLDAMWEGDTTDSPEGVITYTGHGGEYQVTYDWRIFGPPVPTPPAAQGVIYAVQDIQLDPRTGRRTGGHLLWYRHDGRGDGSFSWTSGSGNKVGNGWNNFLKVFSGGDGVIYAIEHAGLDPRTGQRLGGHLLWYRHDGRSDGSFTWAGGTGAKVGNGWANFKHVFSGGDGVIYVITDNGALAWYRHDGWSDGIFAWNARSSNALRFDWTNFKHVFSGGDGVIYAVKNVELDARTGRRSGGDLMWYRHDGWRDGGSSWAAGDAGKKVGTGWGNFKHVFAGRDGVIYAVQENGDLLWYRHDGRGDGSFKWATGSGNKVGNGWNFLHVFSG